MLDPATVLEGLDPEQRRVAEALRGPVRVLAGAGTGKTRAITHRIAHGVATGVYQPTEVLAVTFTTRAAGEMRGRLRNLGADRRAGPHLPLRRAPPAAVLLAARPRQRPAHADRVQARHGRHGHLAPAGPRRPGDPARRRLRDRVGQGQQRPPRRLRPAGAAHRPLGQQRRPRDGRPHLRHLRGRQARAGADGHGGRPAPDRRHARGRRAGRRPGTPPVQVVRRRRVPGRLAHPVGPPRPVARRARRDLRRRRPRADDLLLRRRRRVLPPRLPEEVRRHHLDRPGPQLPLHPRGDRGGQRPARRHGQRGRPAAGAGRLRSRGDLRAVRRRGRGGRGRRRRRPAAPRRGHPTRRGGGAVPDQRAVRGLRGGAGRPGPALRPARRRPLLRPRRGT